MDSGYPKRICVCLSGLIISGIGMYCIVQATNVGIGAWETFQTGISLKTGILYGNCSVMVSFAVILIDVLLGGKIGVGTFCNAVLVGKTVDFFHLYCDILPQAQTLPLGLAYLIIGMILHAVGIVVYMRPGLGCGPRDTLMVLLAKKLPNVNIGFVRFGIEMCVFLIGILLGAPYGWGSVFAIASTSFIMQAVFKLFRFQARTVQHESIRDTYRCIRGLS